MKCVFLFYIICVQTSLCCVIMVDVGNDEK